MRHTDEEFELVVGGPQGIRLHREQTTATGPVRGGVIAPDPGRLLGEGQRWIAAYGHFGALVLTVLGVVALGLAVLIIEGMGLPRLLYLPAMVFGGTAWVAAIVVRGMRHRSQRSLSVAMEREILTLAARTDGPLTIAEAARVLGRPLAEVEHALNEMSRAGHATADVDLETGQLQFSVPTSNQSVRQEPR